MKSPADIDCSKAYQIALAPYWPFRPGRTPDRRRVPDPSSSSRQMGEPPHTGWRRKESDSQDLRCKRYCSLPWSISHRVSSYFRDCLNAKLTVRYVYAPFGGLIMRHVQTLIAGYQGPNIKAAKSAESAKLGPRTTAESQHAIKAGRLKGQLFACRSIFLSC